MESEGGRGWKFWAIAGGLGALVVFALIVWGLYSLGDDDQSALERFRDIAVIFVVLLFLVTVILLTAITAALGYLVIVLKNEAIPTLKELNAIAKRFRGTAEFVTEEAVKPIIGVAGAYARMRATMKTVTGRNQKKK
ncbi:MAG TPA: hypothetical protein VIL01_15055 [Thermomicrobiales bacterium]